MNRSDGPYIVSVRDLTRVEKRDGRIVPFTKVRITNAVYKAAVAVGGRDRKTAEEIADAVVAYLAEHPARQGIPTVEEIQDAVEKVLIERGHAKTAKAFILYRNERARARSRETGRDGDASRPIPYAKLWKILDWHHTHRLASLAEMNARIERGEWDDVVAECEDAYHIEIAEAADAILARRDEVRLVIVAGPSSSGKTTTTLKISEHLAREGFRFIPFHVDDYFFDLELHPKDEFGDYDYETPHAIDLDLVNEHLRRLLAGERVRVPKFDFKSGRRHDEAAEMHLAPNEILLVDSLHGLFPKMTEGIPPEAKFRLYIEPLLQMRGPGGRFIRWTDLRLCRRMVRDRAQRGRPPDETLEHWHYVRKAELNYIVGHADRCDVIANGAIPYEIPVMRYFLLDDFRRWRKEYEGVAGREDAHARAVRVGDLLEAAAEVGEAEIERIPRNALTREFIGGSVYKY